MLNLNRVIEDIDKMIRRLIGDDIEVRTLLADDLENVNADPGQMEQVIVNFCVNARDAMPEGGRIVIETHNLEVDEAFAAQKSPLKAGRYVRLEVTDTGTGIDQHTLSQIFDPFFTTKGPDKGTGLGLATVYGIVKQSGGQVWARSEPGQGSTFTVYLPATTEKAEPREQETRRLKSRAAQKPSWLWRTRLPCEHSFENCWSAPPTPYLRQRTPRVPIRLQLTTKTLLCC